MNARVHLNTKHRRRAALHMRPCTTMLPLSPWMLRLCSCRIFSHANPIQRDTSPSRSSLTLICNARSANGWTRCSSTDSQDRRMINEERTNMYDPRVPGFASEYEYGIQVRRHEEKKTIDATTGGKLHKTSRTFLYDKTEILRTATLNYIQGNLNYEGTQGNYFKKCQLREPLCKSHGVDPAVKRHKKTRRPELETQTVLRDLEV